VIALRGTVDYTEWFDDLEVWPVPFTPVPDAGWVENGFFQIFQSMQARGEDGPPVSPYDLLASLLDGSDIASVTVVGHSLGGALATMFALVAAVGNPELASLLTLYTLASPALGDGTFADYFDTHVPQSFRVWNEADIVPLALTFLYTHVDGTGNEIIQTPEQIADIVPSWSCEHGLLTYLWLLDPNNYFADEFRAGSCWQVTPAAAAARRTLRAQQLALRASEGRHP
jgi:triacylglycerol lipase